MSEENKDMGSSFEIGSLEQRLRQAVDEIDNIKLSFTKNTEELSRIKTMLDVEALKEITSTIRKYEELLMEAQKQREEAYQGAKKYSDELEKEKERLIKLWDAYKHQEEELSKTESKLQEYQERVNKLENERQELTNQINSLQQQLNEYTQQINQLNQYRQQIEEFDTIKQKLEEENNFLQHMLRERDNQIQVLQQEVDKLKQLENQIGKYNQLAKEYEKEKERLTKLYHLYEETEKECNRLREEMKHWENWYATNKEIFDRLFSLKPPSPPTTTVTQNTTVSQPKQEMTHNTVPSMTTETEYKKTKKKRFRFGR